MESVKKILLIKLRHHGDVLLTTPLIAGLRYFFKDAKIDCLIYEESTPILQHHPEINAIHIVSRTWRKKGIFHRFLQEKKLIQAIQNTQYQLVLNLTEGDRGAIYTYFSNAQYRIGLDPEGKGFFGKAKVYTHLVRHHGLFKHTVEMQLEFLRVLQLNPPYFIRELLLKYEKNHVEAIRQYVLPKTILVHPVSRWMFKAIPVDSVSYVIKQLQERGYHIILTASSDEKEVEYVNELMSMIDCGSLKNLTGQLSLLELAALIDQVDLVLTCDSLPMHMAAAFKKPQVALFGPTSSIKWAPWRNPYATVVEMKLPCQPCYKAGCQNTGISDCLVSLPKEIILKKVLSTIEKSPVLNSERSLQGC
jgi:heptosyltransferase-3